MQDTNIRERKNVLKVLKQIQQQQNYIQVKINKQKQSQSLNSFNKKVRYQNSLSDFYKKINRNNIFSQPYQQELLSKEQQDEKRLIKWKAYRLKNHRTFLSIFYLIEVLLIVSIFVLSSFMACIHGFVEAQMHHQTIPLIIIGSAALISLAKMFFRSTFLKYRKGKLIQYVVDIFQMYASSWIFYIDIAYFVTLVVLFYQMFNKYNFSIITTTSLYLYILSILQIFASRQKLTFFRTTFIDGFLKQQFFKLFKLMVFNCLVAHSLATTLLSLYYLNEDHNWIKQKKLDTQDWHIQYMWSFYWSTTIMTSIGFGDYTAITYQEAYIIAFLQLFSCITLAYNISQIGNIIYAMRVSQQQYVAKVATFKRMAQKNKVSHDLKLKIQDYLKEQFQIKQNFQYNQQNELLNSLPQTLKKQFISQSNNRIFPKLKFFRSLQSRTLIDLAQNFKDKVYYPGQNLLKASQFNDNVMVLKEGKVGLIYCKLHSILNGIIVQQIETLNRHINFIKSDDHIPVLLNYSFLTPGKWINYNVSSLDYSYISKIELNSLLQIIKSNKLDAQEYFNIIHSHNTYQKQWFQFLCQRCSRQQLSSDEQNIKRQNNSINNEFHHNKFDCPKLHFIPYQKMILRKYLKRNKDTQPGKKIFYRKKLRSQSCLILRKKLYKVYQIKRFINQRKRYQKIVKQHRQNTQNMISLTKLNKLPSLAKIKSKPINSVKFSQKLIQTQSIKDINKLTSKNKITSILQTPEQFWQQNNGNDVEQVIEQVVKNTVDEMVPKKIINMNYWDLQIDSMHNYQNYFPQSNPQILDNFVLCDMQMFNKKKALAIFGEIMRNFSGNKQKSQSIDLLGIESQKLISQNKISCPSYQPYEYRNEKDIKQRLNPIYSNVNREQIRYNKIIPPNRYNISNQNSIKVNFGNVRYEIQPQNNNNNKFL